MNWDSTTYFQTLTERNILAQSNNFVFTRCAGLNGLEEMLHLLQNQTAFVCVDDTEDGQISLNNAPHSRRVKTVYFVMRHAYDDMIARQQCIDTMFELFRQFMSDLILEKTRLQENKIYLDERIQFKEINQYFAAGCAVCYFQLAVEVQTNLVFNKDEWR